MLSVAHLASQRTPYSAKAFNGTFIDFRIAKFCIKNFENNQPSNLLCPTKVIFALPSMVIECITESLVTKHDDVPFLALYWKRIKGFFSVYVTILQSKYESDRVICNHIQYTTFQDYYPISSPKPPPLSQVGIVFIATAPEQVTLGELDSGVQPGGGSQNSFHGSTMPIILRQPFELPRP